LLLEDLYLPDGRYGRWNAAGILATIVGCALAWGGLVVPALRPLYDYAWFVGFGTAAITYFVLVKLTARGL
jgi:NCS1 family nucleobase:cation symporter-1